MASSHRDVQPRLGGRGLRRRQGRVGVSLRELLHLDTYLLMFDMGGMPLDRIAGAIEMVGAEVIPQLR